MKAVVLAGGLGSRAKPFTDFSPKPLIPIFDRPLIDYIVRYLCSFEKVIEILIVTNLSGRGKQVVNYFEGKESRLGKKITFLDDINDGTGGAILRAKPNLESSEPFTVWFSDNLCPIDLDEMMSFHSKTGALGCVAVSWKKREETGFARVTSKGLVAEFLEKPMVKLQTPECLGIYAFSYEILNRIEKVRRRKRKVNLSSDVLQNLSANDGFYAYDISDVPWIDIESPAKLERNLEFVKVVIERMKRK